MLVLLFIQFFIYKETLSGTESLICDSLREINKKGEGKNEAL
jgi:hypothetical protein